MAIDHKTWSTMLAGGAPIYAIADHLGETDHPLAPLFRGLADSELGEDTPAAREHNRDLAYFTRIKRLHQEQYGVHPHLWRSRELKLSGLHPDVQVNHIVTPHDGYQMLEFKPRNPDWGKDSKFHTIRILLGANKPPQEEPEQLARHGPIDHATWSTMFAGGAPLYAIADHLEETEHPFAKMFRRLSDLKMGLDTPAALELQHNHLYHVGAHSHNPLKLPGIHPDVAVTAMSAGEPRRVYALRIGSRDLQGFPTHGTGYTFPLIPKSAPQEEPEQLARAEKKPIDHNTWSTMFAGNAPIYAIADHLEEIDHPLAPLFRRHADRGLGVPSEAAILLNTHNARRDWPPGWPTLVDKTSRTVRLARLHPDVQVKLISYRGVPFALSVQHPERGVSLPLIPGHDPENLPKQLSRPLTKAQLNTGAIPVLRGTRLLYQLKKLHELGDEDLSARVRAALQNRGDSHMGQSNETNWRMLGESLKAINHEMAGAYNWHRIGHALDVDAAVKKYIETKVLAANTGKVSASNIFRLTNKHVGSSGKGSEELKAKFYAGLMDHVQKTFSRPDEIYATDPVTGEQKTRKRSGTLIDKKHFTREMLERSLHRLAAHEDDREVVANTKPKEWRQYLSLLPTSINVANKGKKVVASPSKLRNNPEQYARIKPNTELQALVRQYHEQHKDKFGLDLPVEGGSFPWTEEQSKLTAKLFNVAKHLPDHPAVRKTYDQFKQELLAQYEHLAKAGYKMEPWTQPGQPYKSSAEMAEDVRNNRHIWYFPTAAGFGSGEELPNHPLNENSGVNLGNQPAKWNDLLRAVHDIWGHALSGNQFGAKGELAAWGDHARSFSKLARAALSAETHGQNSWVNFGPHSNLPVTERPYADQKATILPKNAVPKFQMSRFGFGNLSRPYIPQPETVIEGGSGEYWVNMAAAPGALPHAIADHLEEIDHPLAPFFAAIAAQGKPHIAEGTTISRSHRPMSIAGTGGERAPKAILRFGTTSYPEGQLILHIRAGDNQYSTPAIGGELGVRSFLKLRQHYGVPLTSAVTEERPTTYQLSATRPATVNLSGLGQQRIEMLRRLAQEAKLKVIQVRPSEELGTSGIHSGVLSEVAHRNEADAAEYVAHWFSLLTNPDTAHAFHVSPNGKDTLVRVPTPLAPTKALEKFVGLRNGGGHGIIRAVSTPSGSDVYSINPRSINDIMVPLNANTYESYNGIHTPLRSGQSTVADRRNHHRDQIQQYEARVGSG